MRVLKIFFSFVLALAILSLLIGLIWREFLLYSAVNQMRSAAKELRILQPDAEFSQSCLEFGGSPITDQSLTRTQLRFTSDRDFVLEIVCQTNESLRRVVKEMTLPMLVTKGSGQSGLISWQIGHGLTLSVLGRTGVVYEGDSSVQSSLNYRDEPVLIFDQGPATVCTGYGFFCCNESYQMGQDQQSTKAWDCPRSCYANCVNYPAVLSFYSNPSFSTIERILEVKTGESIDFFYVINDVQQNASTYNSITEEEWANLNWLTKIIRIFDNWQNQINSTDSLTKVVINFGDGQTAEFFDLQGMATHTYTCNKQLCVFNAAVQATTKGGLTSTANQQSNIQIKVQGQ